MEANQWDPKPALSHPEALHYVQGIVCADRPSTITEQLLVCPIFLTVKDSIQATFALIVFVVLVNSRNVRATVYKSSSLRGGMPYEIVVPVESTQAKGRNIAVQATPKDEVIESTWSRGFSIKLSSHLQLL